MRKFVHRRGESKDKTTESDPMDANERTITFSKEMGEENWKEEIQKEEETTQPDKSKVNQNDFKVKSSQNRISTINSEKKSSNDKKEEVLETPVGSESKIEQAKKTYDEQKRAREDLTKQIFKKSENVQKAKKDLRTKTEELQKIFAKNTDKKLYNDKFSVMGKYTSQMAHDIKNPLSLIKLQVDYMKLKYATAEDEIMFDSLNNIEKAIGQITNQVNDVLNFMRETPTEFKKCDVHEMVNSCLEVLKIPENVNIEVSENHGFVNCDEAKTKSVFSNVLFNAVQAVGDKGEINVEINEDENNMIISVQDSGEGIPEENLEKIFEPLFTTKKGGTGLGLANCKQILENQGANITVKNNPTTFTIEFPKYSESQ